VTDRTSLGGPARCGSLAKEHAIPALGLLAAVAVYLHNALRYMALIGPYLVDDAFIFFRYADNFARGHGLVYNPGDPVEGYTSPLWAFTLGAAARAGLPLIETAQWTGIGLGVLTLVLTGDIARRLFPRSLVAVLPPLFLATNRTFCIWSVEGMETKLFGASVSAMLWIWMRFGPGAPEVRGLPLLGLAGAVTVLSRPEGAMFVALLAPFAVAQAVREHRILRGIADAAMFVVIIASHLAFRWVTYHDLLPNTFYAKVSGLDIQDGLRYAADVARGNRVAWYGFVTVLAGYRWLRQGAGELAAVHRWIVWGTLAFLVYTIGIGGDFFEFRFIDPVLPLWAFMTASGLEWVRARIRRRAASWITVGALAGCWITLNVQTILHPISGRSMTTPERARHGTARFAQIGRWLALNLEPDDVISVRAAGVLPYLSRARTVDALGLNDREIARSRKFVVEGAPGHRRRVPAWYLRRRGVTYLVRCVLTRRDSPAGDDWIVAEVQPGAFLHMRRLQDDAALKPGVYRLGEHRGSLDGWEPVSIRQEPGRPRAGASSSRFPLPSPPIHEYAVRYRTGLPRS
jgi:hypothetical protein